MSEKIIDTLNGYIKNGSNSQQAQDIINTLDIGKIKPYGCLCSASVRKQFFIEVRDLFILNAGEEIVEDLEEE